jgi:TusA-related sulfurtransferase
VVLTKQALSKAPEGIEVLVDNKTAQDNVSRFAKIAGYQAQTEQDGADFRIILSR